MVSANDNGERKVTSLRELPQSVEPPRDLWSGIEARIAAERRAADATVGGRGATPQRVPSRPSWFAVAAVTAALAVGMWVGRSLLPSTSHTTTTLGGPGTSAHISPGKGIAAGNGANDVLQAAYVTDPKYRQQREALAKSLEAQLTALPPETRAKVIASLATIHKSMQDLQAALGRDPSNALLQELLVNTYQDEMRVLTAVHEASDAGKGI
jgi:hypothetical protein